jgi:hypothetical protein
MVYHTKESKIKLEFKIKTQLLTTSSIERSLIIDNNDVYNNMTREFNNVHKSVFKLQYRSLYTNTDIDVLNSCRTVAVSAQLREYPTDLGSLVEIDKSKAYTEACTKINKIPYFNEFDV